MTQLTDLEIAPATPADIPLLLDLIRELAEYERLAPEAISTAASLHGSLFGPERSAEAVVARVGSTPAGFALYFHNFSTFLGKRGLYLEDLFVRPEFRGRAIGKSLLIYLAKLAVARDCGRFEWAVLDWNRPARDFYERLGAKANSAWVSYRLTGDALTTLANH